jgi:surfeit locus 1 family protein
MNILKLQNFLINFKYLNKNFKINQKIRLNTTKTQPSSEPSQPQQQQKSVKNLPISLDLNTLRPSKNQNNYKQNKQEYNYTGAIILASIPIITFCLFIWQIQRREQKIEMIKLLEERTESNPIELPANIEVLKQPEYEYRPFKATGHFDHSREVLLTIRQDTTKTYNVPGAFVITPFVLSDRKLTILVNRGFVPYTQYSVENRKEAQIEGDIEIVGLLRTDEKSNLFAPENKPLNNEWHMRDINLMALCLETAPVFLDATYENTVRNRFSEPIGPVGGQTIVYLRNEHAAYITTWFCLSAITSVLWYLNYGKFIFKK